MSGVPVDRDGRHLGLLNTSAEQTSELSLRLLEALLFSAREPLGEAELAARLPEGAPLMDLLARLQAAYAGRGVELVRVAGKWRFQTASDLAERLAFQVVEPRKLSRAGLETLAIIAYHQPVTRADIEAIRGVSVSKGTLDLLLETGWVRLRGRRQSPGRPVTYGTTLAFLEQFGLDNVGDLPGLDELKALGLLDGTLPGDFHVPRPRDGSTPDPVEEVRDPLEEVETPVPDPHIWDTTIR